MQGEIRKSGIGVIGEVTWGTHFCQFYQTKQDLIDILVPYFKAGLENNEFCMWVTADNLTVEEARKAMIKAMKGFSTYLKKGQIEILPYTEWYLRDGTFNSQSVLNGWIEKLNHALKKGYDGLRLTGNTFWLENKDRHSFTEYEASVNNVIGNYKIIALCTYCLDKCGATEIVDVIRNHEFALIKRAGKWELFENSRYKITINALKQSEQHFKAIAASTPDHILVQDRDLRYTFVVNPQIGLTEKDMLGKTDYDILKPEDAEKLTKIKRQVIETGKAVHLETPVANTKGEMDYFSGSYVPRYNEEGKIDGLIGYFEKITERKKAEEDLIRLNRELQAIRECDQAIVHAKDEKSLLSDVCRILSTTVGYRLAWVGAVERDETKSIRPLVWHGDEEYIVMAHITWADTERGRGPTGLAARTGKTHFFQDFTTDPHSAPWREAALSRGYRSSIALPVKNEDGSVFAVLSLYSAEPNTFNSNEITLLEELTSDVSFGIGVLHEKAKRQQAETEMAHLASFPELNPNPIIEMDGQGHITYMNPAVKAQLPDFSTLALKHPFLVNGKVLAQRLKSDPTQPLTRQIEVGESWYEQTLMYITEKNTYRLYARNITAIKKAEDILKDNEERNRLILETALDGVWTNDLSGRLLYVNDAYCEMIGYSREELLKMYVYNIEAKEKRDETSEHINKVVQQGGDRFETRHIRKDGRIIDVEISVRYSDMGGGQLVVFARNITERKQILEELKKSQEQFSKAFHSSPVALSISRISDGIFIDVNRSFQYLFGYKRDELIGRKATELNIYDKPNDRNEIVRLLQQEGKVVNYEVTARTNNGSEIKVLTSAEKIEINGELHIIWTTIDITERQQAEDLLRETSNYLNNLLDYANAPIIVWDPHFRISRFNPAFERLTGYKSQDIIGLGLDVLFPGDKKTESLQQIDRTLSGERWEVVEIPILRVDGEIRTVLWNSANVYDTDGKTIIATIAQGQDITERKRAEESLKETGNYLNNLIDYANAPIIVWDPEFRITRFNHAFERLTDIGAGEAIGKQLDILFPEDNKAHSMEHIRSTVSGEHWEAVEIPILRKDGATRIVLWNSATLFGLDGNIVATIAQGHDITERKQAEEEVKKLNEELKQRAGELEVANKELEAFAYSVSHDLRAPLRSMEGFSQALLEECQDILNDECKNYLKRIQGSAELMAQLIDDMLRLSRITRADMIMDNVNLTEMAQTIAAKLKNDEPKRDVKFVITPGLTAYGDEKLLSIMMGNLFENAWKFTGKVPEAQIEFGLTESDSHKTFFIRDNGVGFDMTYANKLFKPFQRLHSTDDFPGSGIGLASVQRIVQRHGGKVWAEGKVGEGATFYFTLG